MSVYEGEIPVVTKNTTQHSSWAALSLYRVVLAPSDVGEGEGRKAGNTASPATHHPLPWTPGG